MFKKLFEFLNTNISDLRIKRDLEIAEAKIKYHALSFKKALRPCFVKGKPAYFHSWFNTVDGVNAIIEYMNGKVDEVPILSVSFLADYETKHNDIIIPDGFFEDTTELKNWLDEMLSTVKSSYSILKYTNCAEAVLKIKNRL